MFSGGIKKEHWLNWNGLNKNSHYIDQFLLNASILYPPKTPENIRFSGVFGRGYKIGILTRHGLIKDNGWNEKHLIILAITTSSKPRSP